MKRQIVLLYLLLIAVLPICAQTVQVDTTHVSAPKVLIISSYQVDTDWSEKIINEIVAKLERQFPDIHVFVGHMNLNTYTLPANPLYTLRATLWSYADSDPTTITAEDGRVNSLFASSKRPDVLVFVGDDGFLFYQNYGPWLGPWKDVPIVLCSVTDEIINTEWLSGNTYNFNSLIPIEERRNVETFVSDRSFGNIDAGLESKRHEVLPGYLVKTDYNLTGVKNSLPIRENLDLIHHLMPNLEEIVWVDNDFYSAAYAQWLLKGELSTKYPNVKFSEIRQNRFNTDSIYNELLTPKSNRIYLTYSWDVDGTFSRQTDEQIHTLFTNYASVPLFSLTRRALSNPYWVGGYYRPYAEFADKSVKQISRVLHGENANDIPFEIVNSGQTTLDQPLLKKYGLWNELKSLPGVELVNIPPTYYEENEELILASVIVGAIILGLLAYWISRNRYTRKVHKEYMRYRKLYNKLHLIYGHTSTDLALYDKEGKLIFSISKGREQIFGGDKGGVFSDNLFENSNLSHKLREQLRNNQSINSEVTVYVEGELSSVDSERKVYQLMVKPLSDENTQSAKYVAIAINLNQIIREREERERFENLVRFASDSSQMGIAFYSLETGEGTATNSWYSNLNEQIAPGLLPTYEHVVSEDRNVLIGYRERVRAGEILPPLNKDIRVLDENGEEHWITQHIFTNHSDRKMLIELNLNIDEQKKAETVLLSAKEKVEHSIIETQNFLANINHEIRTPLNSIVGFSAILAASESEEERKEHVSLILKNNKLLTMLIDDVIELSRIDSGQTTFGWEPVKVDDLFRKVMMTGYSDLYDKQLNVVLDLDKTHPIVYTDSEALFRLLKNLFSNAIKFTHEGSVTLGYRMKHDCYYFFVKDTGCGIDIKDQKRIFKRFDKLDSYAQGTGLGLALCKSIVEHLDGKIGVDSELREGSTFWFELPIQ
ncbi:ATP-binding protein [Bacteroides sp. 51]|uniref:sensor histidine kinase n=1 Tax=Bacteroides sp. 51 TaxID=2302938 RepID=UPI0013CFB42A|nr:ATP-binding protein [Bacteroides sp. 51]NDV81693.1 hypothetical protein [Bacteroides sp. 51]